MYEGQIIRFLRKERRISQTLLAKDICSVRHLSNIEAGRSAVSYELVVQFMHRLETDISLFVNKDIQKYGLDLFKEFQELEYFFYNWDYIELYESIKRVQKKYHFESFLAKKLTYYKAICIHEIFGDYKLAKEMLLEMLGNDSYDEIKKSLKYFKDQLDLNIINALCVNLSYTGYKSISLKLFIAIKDNLIKYNSLNTEFGIKTLYNIIKLQYDTHEFEKSLEAAKECVAICEKNKQYRLLPDVYHYYALAKKNLEHMDYEIYYKKSLYLLKIFNYSVKVNYLMDSNKDEVNLDLDEDIFKPEV